MEGRLAARARRGGALVTVALFALAGAACHGGGGAKAGGPSTTHPVDVKAACAALADLRRSADALSGVDVSDPVASRAALDRAVAEYAAVLIAFERAAPVSLADDAEAIRAAVLAHHFSQAAADRVEIDRWSAAHCTTS